MVPSHFLRFRALLADATRIAELQGVPAAIEKLDERVLRTQGREMVGGKREGGGQDSHIALAWYVCN